MSLKTATQLNISMQPNEQIAWRVERQSYWLYMAAETCDSSDNFIHCVVEAQEEYLRDIRGWGS